MKYTFDDITFIIPVKLDSPDRIRNLILCVNWLHNIHDFKFIIKECDKYCKFECIKNKLRSNNIKYLFEENQQNFFHKTKILNDMLEICDTHLICMLDCDVILEKCNLLETLKKFDENFDIVYPFTFGEYQKRIHGYESPKECLNENIDFFIYKWEKKQLLQSNFSSQYGHAMFIKNEVYKNSFGENENFKSYGPEDVEKFYRYTKLDYKVTHLPNDFYIHHMEHHRGIDSSSENIHFDENNNLFNTLMSLSKQDLIDTYKKYNYVKIRKFG